MNWAVFFTSLLVGLVLQPLLIPWLKRRGVVDVPNERSSHVEITPRGGGIAVVLALGAGLLVGPEGGWDVAIMFLGALILGTVGFTDDFRGLSARMRLGILLVVGALVGIFLSSPLPLVLSVAVMAVWTATYVNAFNFMDGINGISGLSGIVTGFAYALMGHSFGSSALQFIGLALAGSCLSFLPFNLLRTRVFLGDVGSYALGFVIASCAWLAWAGGAPLLIALAPTSVYLVDTGSTLIRRALAGDPLMEAHRSHVYQRLAGRGRSHAMVATAVAALTAAIVIVVWTGYERGIPAAGLVAAAGLLAIYANSAPRPNLVEGSAAPS